MSNENIFVQIASYKDPELKPTIINLFNNAAFPENIVVGICWQHDENEKLDFIAETCRGDHGTMSLPNTFPASRFRIIDVDWRKSKGVGWARSEVQKLYNNERYTLQLDSHHRFIKNWDKELIEMFKSLQLEGSRKPLITTYGGVYDPSLPNPYTDNRPFKMITSGFTPEGILLFYPDVIPSYEKLTKPVKGRFVSGHFYFTHGFHCKECRYDPNIYFHGEEISLSVRSYTLGYDIYHPHKLILWHNYIRTNRVKHWDDHVENKKDIDVPWHKRDSISKNIVYDSLTKNISNGIYGFGLVRTIKDYEKYAGVNFKNKTVEKGTMEGVDPV